MLSAKDDDYIRSETNIYCLYFVIAGIAVGTATFLQISTFSVAGERLTERIRDMAFCAMLRQEVGWFDNKSNGTGTLCARLSSDSAAVQGVSYKLKGSIHSMFKIDLKILLYPRQQDRELEPYSSQLLPLYSVLVYLCTTNGDWVY